jgi:hypothetical protein
VTDPAPARVRSACPDDLTKLCELERIAGAPFRELGMDFVADDETWTVAELESYQRDGRAWVIDDAAGEPVAYLLAATSGGSRVRAGPSKRTRSSRGGSTRAPRTPRRCRPGARPSSSGPGTQG